MSGTFYSFSWEKGVDIESCFEKFISNNDVSNNKIVLGKCEEPLISDKLYQKINNKYFSNYETIDCLHKIRAVYSVLKDKHSDRHIVKQYYSPNPNRDIIDTVIISVFTDGSLKYMSSDITPSHLVFIFAKAPALTRYTEYWYRDNIEQRESGPAIIDSVVRAGELIVDRIKFKKSGVLHKENGPAYIGFIHDTDTAFEHYYVEGKVHREDGPAQIYISEGHQMFAWYKNNLAHRLDGPAVVIYNKDGCTKKWYINGKRLLPSKHLCLENGKAVSTAKLTKYSALKMMLFDREYGEYVFSLLKANEEV